MDSFLLGIVGNIITIAVFHSQGYKDTINISLTAIALWDLLKCLTGALFRLCGPIQAFSPSLELTYDAIGSLAFAFPSFFCTYVSAVLAAYVSVERCLCVSLPFTVKYLLTPAVVTSVMVALSAFTFGSLAVLLAVYRIVWVRNPLYGNATIAQLGLKTDAAVDYQSILKYYNVVSFVWPVVSLAIQCVCTWVISYHLRKSAKFRAGNLSGAGKKKEEEEEKGKGQQVKGQGQGKGQGKGMSSRDRQVNKMLLVVIVVYIINLFPRVVMAVAKTAVPDFYVFGRYHNFFQSCVWFQSLFDFVNGAINPVIFYFMSTQFRASIQDMFPRCSRSTAM